MTDTSPQLGLCSVTLRQLEPNHVIDVAAEAGLTCIEWGGDIHVPPGDLDTASAVRVATEAAGLRVASYGSYFRAGSDQAEEIVPVLRTASALGADRIRIWAGVEGSHTADPATAAAVVATVQRSADLAAESGLHLAFEFHGGTLADSPEAVLQLLSRVGRPSVGTYWQPPEGVADDIALVGLAQILPHVRALHAFSWWPVQERHPLDYRADLWRQAMRLVHGHPLDILLEFVEGDDPQAVVRDAHALRALIEECS